LNAIFSLALTSVLAGTALVAQTPNPIANQIVGVGYRPPAYPAVALGAVVTLFVNDLNVPDAVAPPMSLPTSLSGVSVSVRTMGTVDASNFPFPVTLGILRVFTEACGQFVYDGYCPTTQITIQIPPVRVCIIPGKVACGSFGAPPLLVLKVQAHGVVGPDMPLHGLVYLPHLLNTCDRIFGPPGGACNPVITHADGSIVSAGSPAKVGEEVVIYAVGLEAISTFLETLVFGYRIDPDPPATTFYVPQEVNSVYTSAVPGFVGLFQINIVIPPMPTQTFNCQGATSNNATISGLTLSSGALSLCVVR
jgi:hypothetical protein